VVLELCSSQYSNYKNKQRGKTKKMANQSYGSFALHFFSIALKIERAHRMGYQSTDPSKLIKRKIVCKFAYFKDRETVRKQHFKLDGKQYFMHEQFPPEVEAKRKRLILKFREARAKNHNAWISYDTLFIDGKPINLE
jgi:hypothetical protein